MAYTDIDFPAEYFNTLLYAGNSTGGRSITGVGFAPDFLWLKDRTTAGSAHFLSDTVRGDGKWLRTNGTFAENTDTNVITSLDSDGFTVGTDVYSNNTGDNYVAWNWKANGAGVSNTDGTITSTVSVSTTSGFSIVSYTGNSVSATVGHGLGVAPKFIIIKHRNDADDWTCYHTSLGASQRIQLNNTGASSALSWGGSPTSSVFYLLGGGATAVNVTGGTYIAYCFAEVKGYSKFGSYAGNNNADGTFVYTGFSPSFVLVKRYGGGTQNWVIYDNKRNTYNLTDSTLRPNTSGAEATNNGVDLLSNGFKFRSSDGDSNGYSDGYIYMAFAEHPFVTSTGIPTTAR